MNERQYHIIAIVLRTGAKIYMTRYSMNHRECCTMMSKMSRSKYTRILLEEVTK